ncbi:DNA topoisomerase 3-alpha, partial [Bienertia sinuspersici]
MVSHQSQFSWSASSESRLTAPQLYCYHNEIAPLRVVKHHGPNMGKRFYGCVHWLTCGFFKWADESNEIRDLQLVIMEKNVTIAELEYETDILKAKVTSLKKKLAKRQDMVDELSIEYNERMLQMDAVFANKRMTYALIMSWEGMAVKYLEGWYFGYDMKFEA